ncbi:MAG TPA: hypothetical protein VJN19_12390 [Propionibacteriaceae bacterium]|nr:hypothetical protein [Propionibacteriaceae bacterium]
MRSTTQIGFVMTATRSPRMRVPLLLKSLYVVLVIAAVSLAVMLLQDLVAALEGEGGELHHLFVFDLAWFVFLVAGLASVVAGVAALVIGRLRADARFTRYGLWAVGFVVLAIAVVVVGQSLEAPPTDHT